MSPPRKAFFAYPSSPNDLVEPVEAACRIARDSGAQLEVTPWPQAAAFGASIPDEIREAIRASDTVVCDITIPNPNVYYEFGFAIGAAKAVAPVLNKSFAGASARVQKDGIFDNILYRPYENSHQLAGILTDLPTTVLSHLYAREPNREQPILILDTFSKTDFRNAIVNAVKDSRLFYRSFDPLEFPRLQAVWGIGEVSASTGVLIPLIGSHVQDAPRHNLRAAFLAGLSHGFQRETLIISYLDTVDSADFRDLVHTVKSNVDIDQLVAAFAGNALVLGQSVGNLSRARRRSALQTLSLGASAAENEFRVLDAYFVETAEYIRASEGHARLVTGRKGTGKTAIFFRVRDVLRARKNYIVLDLKPESYQLSRFRSELSRVADLGLFDHTLSAFWYYVILSEVLIKIIAILRYEARRSPEALEKLKAIEQTLPDVQTGESGDFTSRLNRLSQRVMRGYRDLITEAALSPEKLTNDVFGDARPLRDAIVAATTSKTKIVVLFDNIDKGWPADGVSEFDIRSVRLLIESLERLRRDLSSRGRECWSLTFLRNDVYELLVSQTPDRGKTTRLSIDWTDRSKLRQVIARRLQVNQANVGGTFAQAWEAYFRPTVQGRDSFEYFVDHCLMRPRFLIDIIENALAHAINRGHDRVEEEDCQDAVKQYASNLLSEFGYEIGDVSPITPDIFYGFIGYPQELSQNQVREGLRASGVRDEDIDDALRLALWYGALGLLRKGSVVKYIYDYQYDLKRLQADMRNAGDDVSLFLNPALYVALSS